MIEYNEEYLSLISKESNISIKELLKKAENFVIYNYMNLYSEGNAVGQIIKEHKNCGLKLGELVHSNNGNYFGNLYKFYSVEPSKIKKYIPQKENNEHSMSDIGYNYFLKNINNLLKDDPPQTIQALNFIRYLLKQGNTLIKSIEISSNYYKLDNKMVASRNASRVNYYRHACNK